MLTTMRQTTHTWTLISAQGQALGTITFFPEIDPDTAAKAVNYMTARAAYAKAQDPLPAESITVPLTIAAQVSRALGLAESFMSGFEGDETQETLDVDLQDVRNAEDAFDALLPSGGLEATETAPQPIQSPHDAFRHLDRTAIADLTNTFVRLGRLGGNTVQSPFRRAWLAMRELVHGYES